jgi:hypothetical protein
LGSSRINVKPGFDYDQAGTLDENGLRKIEGNCS